MCRPSLTPSATALRAWLKGDRGPFAVAQNQPRFGTGCRRLQQGQERGHVSGTPSPCRAGGTSTFLAAGHLHGEKHEGHELENDIHHGRHVDVLVAFVGSFTAEQHIDQPTCGSRRGIVRRTLRRSCPGRRSGRRLLGLDQERGAVARGVPVSERTPREIGAGPWTLDGSRISRMS